jgi:hypothetical protein
VLEGRFGKECGDGIPVMRTTLPLMVCRSASLMITSAISYTKRIGRWDGCSDGRSRKDKDEKKEK